MARIDVTEADVLLALLTRLRLQLSLDENACFETLDPLDLSVLPSGDFFVSVMQGGGTFEEGMQIGGGASQLMEEARFVITYYTRIKLDRGDRAEHILRHAGRGISAAKRAVLKAITAFDLTVASGAGAGSTFLRQLTTIVSASAPAFDKPLALAYAQLDLKLPFDWDLTD